MYKRKKEELEFISSKRRNEFAKRAVEALERNKPLSAKDFLEVKELFE